MGLIQETCPDILYCVYSRKQGYRLQETCPDILYIGYRGYRVQETCPLLPGYRYSVHIYSWIQGIQGTGDLLSLSWLQKYRKMYTGYRGQGTFYSLYRVMIIVSNHG